MIDEMAAGRKGLVFDCVAASRVAASGVFLLRRWGESFTLARVYSQLTMVFRRASCTGHNAYSTRSGTQSRSRDGIVTVWLDGIRACR